MKRLLGWAFIGVGAWFVRAGERLAPETGIVQARGDHLSMMGVMLGVERELDDTFRVRCKRAIDRTGGDLYD